jgi:hypothetical protein
VPYCSSGLEDPTGKEEVETDYVLLDKISHIAKQSKQGRLALQT